MTYRITSPLEDPDSRFHGASIDEVNAKLDADGWAVGADVLEPLGKAYVDYLRGDGDLAYAQLTSMIDAIRRNHP